MKVRFMLFSIERANRINRKFIWIGKKLSKLFFNVKHELVKAGIDILPERYLTACFFSALVYGVIFTLFMYSLFFLRDGAILAETSLISALVGLIGFSVAFIMHLIYPSIMAKKYAAGIDQNLMFALKSLLIQVTSGVSLFNAMINVSKAKYGLVSKEFESVVKNISAGESEAKALEQLALNTKSNYLKRTSWQLLTSLRSGSSLESALQSVVQTLTAYQLRGIKNYSSELNMIILMYLMLAAAIPTLGITFLVVLSAMGGTGIGEMHIIILLFAALVMQIILIGFVKTRIPKVILS